MSGERGQEPTPVHDSIDRLSHYIHERPLLDFVFSEVSGGIASLTVYAAFIAVSYLSEAAAERMPLHDPAPAIFLANALAWCGAFSGAATFAAVSFFALIRLTVRLAKRP